MVSSDFFPKAHALPRPEKPVTAHKPFPPKSYTSLILLDLVELPSWNDRLRLLGELLLPSSADLHQKYPDTPLPIARLKHLLNSALNAGRLK